MKQSALVVALLALALTACGEKPAETAPAAPAVVEAPASAAASAPVAADAASAAASAPAAADAASAAPAAPAADKK